MWQHTCGLLPALRHQNKYKEENHHVSSYSDSVCQQVLQNLHFGLTYWPQFKLNSTGKRKLTFICLSAASVLQNSVTFYVLSNCSCETMIFIHHPSLQLAIRLLEYLWPVYFSPLLAFLSSTDEHSQFLAGHSYLLVSINEKIWAMEKYKQHVLYYKFVIIAFRWNEKEDFLPYQIEIKKCIFLHSRVCS